MPKDINWMQLHDDLERFERRIRLAVYYHQKNNPENEPNKRENLIFPLVPSTKNWTSPKSNNPAIELFLTNVRKEALNPGNIRKARDNLTKEERIAIKNLKCNSNNIIRIQDKGSRVKEWSDKWLVQQQITSKIANWVVNLEPKAGEAFGNVKTQKNNPLRLITSCCGTAIERLSELTEFYLKPLAKKLPAFIKDTTHLINEIDKLNEKGPLPPDTLLVSWDVVVMFSNIDNNLGITAVKKALDSREINFPQLNVLLKQLKFA
ncbi:Hypothetical predicted protein [Paramuricea clavata]|uniref:Uncharacterized protein n=1 Tax=Paramuricea clavata TaxID=317549 RepID=A0A6S7HYX9_PARCT|nr:Hypothetical predicted protein [Paramuricea clavata]